MSSPAPLPPEDPTAAGGTATPDPYRARGPAAATTTVGLIVLVLAGVTIADQILGPAIDWRRVGPWVAIGSGAVIVLVGLFGLVTARRR